MSTEKRRKSQKTADGIEGRTRYMKYRNAQIYLEKKFDFDHPNTLEAIVVSYGFEGMQNIPLSLITDAAMKEWLTQFVKFTKDTYMTDPVDFAPSYEFWKSVDDGWIEEHLKDWDDLHRETKVWIFELCRHAQHFKGYIVGDLYAEYGLDTIDDIEDFYAQLSHVLNGLKTHK
jgi:hypothetical protein